MSQINLFTWELLASEIRILSGTGEAVDVPGGHGEALFALIYSGAEEQPMESSSSSSSLDVPDTLDVFVQTTLDGTNWVDIVHFTQITGETAKRHYAKVVSSEPQAMFEAGAALNAGSVRHLLGLQYRVRWEIVDGAPGMPDLAFEFKVNGSFNA